MPRFIKRKVEVEDPDYVEVYTPGSHRLPEFDLEQTNLFFTGLRGSGKTSLAALVAEELGGVFVDTDDLAAARIGCSISEFVQARGWGGFRLLERDCLQEVCARRGQIVATGGGIVLLPENRELLRANGRVFYLQAEVGMLLTRLAKDPGESKRPALSDLSPAEELAATLREREPFYFQCLDFILQAGKPLQELVEDVLNTLMPDKADFSQY